MRNRKKDQVNDISSDSEFKAKVNMKLDQICNTTTDIKADIKYIQQKQNEHSAEIAVMKENIKTAFMRIDELRSSVKGIEFPKGGKQ